MRVLLVSHLFPPDGVAGVERYTQTLASGLSARGDTVTVATRRLNGAPRIDTVSEKLADGTEVQRYVGGSLELTSFLTGHKRIEELFTRTLVESAPDIVHINHLIALSPRLIEIARRFRIPVVLSLHDFYAACPLAHLKTIHGVLCEGPEGGRKCAATCFAGERDAELRWGLRAAYFRRLLAAVDRVTVPSELLRDYLVRFGAVDERRLQVLPLGIREPVGMAAREPESVDERLVLAYIGVVGAQKGVHLIVEALAAAQLGPVELRIVGHLIDPGYADGLQRAAADVPGLALRLVGTYEPVELQGLLSGVHAAVIPSIVPESFSLTSREALALGIPVIASRIGALPEVIQDGRNGLLFTPGNVMELATALRRYAIDGELRASLAAGALTTPYVTVAEHVAAIRTLYDEALGVPRFTDTADDVAERSFLFDALIDAGFTRLPYPSRVGAATLSARRFLHARRLGAGLR